MFQWICRLLNTSESIAFTEFTDPTRKNIETLSAEFVGAVKVVFDDGSSSVVLDNGSTNVELDDGSPNVELDDGSPNVELLGFVGHLRLMLDANQHQRYHALLVLGENKLIWTTLWFIF